MKVLQIEFYIPPKFMWWNPNPQWDTIRRRAFGGWFDYKGRACMNGISALTKETGELSCLLPMRTVRNDYQPGIGPHQASTSWCLDCRLPASSTVRNKFLSFISHLVYTIFVLAAWADFDTKSVQGRQFHLEKFDLDEVQVLGS